MSEAAWLKSREPGPMFPALYRRGSVRKLRLFNVACCRRIEDLLKVRDRVLLDLASLRADELIRDDNLPGYFAGKGPGAFAAYFAAEAIDPYYNSWALLEKQARSARSCADNVVEAAAEAGRNRGDERLAQANLLREIFGNVFRPALVQPEWLLWRDHTVAHLAQAAYDAASRAGLLIPSKLIFLADALEEAGCSSKEMLAHLRTPGLAHVRGCWVVDLLLEKK